MNTSKGIWFCLLGAGLLFVLPTCGGSPRKNAEAAKSTGQPAISERDGQHDFDVLLGSWKYHLKRRSNPLTGSNTWVEFDGTGVCRKIYDGAEIDQILVDGPAGHIEG